MTKKAVQCIRKLNKSAKIYAFGVSNQKDYDDALSMGIDGVFVDSVEKIKFKK
jgi:glycerophosphoryl diester phosphodiesterase